MDRKMMQRIILIILALVMLLSVIAPAVMATDATETTEAVVRGEYECGDDLTWSFDDGVLTVTGSGEMDDYEQEAPWAAHREEITKVVLEGVAYVGANAFNDYDELVEVDFGTELYELGTRAFYSCEGLTEVSLPKSFKIFGEEAFNTCSNLKKIHCAGVFPSFRQNCLWGVYANIYYPAAAPWSLDLIGQLEEAFHGRIQFLSSDGTDHYTPTEAAEATEATEEVTEETTEETTEATTEPTVETTQETTEAATAATTEAATEAVTVPATQAAEETLPEATDETAPAEEPEPPAGGKGWIGLVIVGGVLALLALGGLAFGGKKHRSGKFSKH